MAPAVHSAHAAALHDLGHGEDAISALRRGVQSAVDPFLPTAAAKEGEAALGLRGTNQKGARSSMELASVTQPSTLNPKPSTLNLEP